MAGSRAFCCSCTKFGGSNGHGGPVADAENASRKKRFLTAKPIRKSPQFDKSSKMEFFFTFAKKELIRR